MPKEKETHYFNSLSDLPFINTDRELFAEDVLFGLISRAFADGLTDDACIVITKIRYNGKRDGAGQPDFAYVDRVVTLRTLRKMYREYLGTSITRKNYKEKMPKEMWRKGL